MARPKLRAATVLALLLALVAAAPAALAAVRAVTSGSQSPATASWGAAAGPAGAQPVRGAAYSITWPVPLAPQYLQITNTGSLPLLSATYTLNNLKPTNGTAPPEVALDACVGAVWSSAANTCAGTVVRLATTSGGTASVTSGTVPAVGTPLSVRAVPVTLPNFPQSFSTTVGVVVTRAQARAATTRTS